MSQPGSSSPNLSIAVAGAGIIGLSLAWRLAQDGFSVTVFDSGAIGAEASWAGAGMLAPGGEIDAPSTLAALAIESRRIYPAFVRELEEATELAIDFQECGALELAYTPDEWSELQEKARRQAELGVESKVITAERLKAFWPRVNGENVAGALFYPGDAIVNPRELVAALLVACRQLGVEVAERCAVRAADISETSVVLETARSASHFDALVIAAGAWSSSIRVSGVAPLPSAEPVKGHLIGYQQPDQTCNTIVRHRHTYLLQRANGLLIAGASVEHVGWNRTIDDAIVTSLAQRASLVLPHLAETTLSESWIGFRPASDDLHLEAWHSKRLYLAYGHYRNGILLSPITAQTLSRLVSANLRTR